MAMTPAPTPTSIPTHYAGCYFRSRLEARWAVFFDELGIRWEYEHQGLLVGPRLGLPPLPYLPDFYLPDLAMWAEVKGDASTVDLRYLCAAGAELAAVNRHVTPYRRMWNRNSLLLLGNVPRPEGYQLGHPVVGCNLYPEGTVAVTYLEFLIPKRSSGWPVEMIGMHNLTSPGVVAASGRFEWDRREPCELGDGDPLAHSIRCATDHSEVAAWAAAPFDVRASWARANTRHAEACRAARSARFEHGESGVAGR